MTCSQCGKKFESDLFFKLKAGFTRSQWPSLFSDLCNHDKIHCDDIQQRRLVLTHLSEEFCTQPPSVQIVLILRQCRVQSEPDLEQITTSQHRRKNLRLRYSSYLKGHTSWFKDLTVVNFENAHSLKNNQLNSMQSTLRNRHRQECSEKDSSN